MGFWDEFRAVFGRSGRPALPAPRADSRFPDARRADAASIVNPLSGIGGTGDKGAASRPTLGLISLNETELEALYTHNGITRRLVDILPARATREGWSVEGVTPSDEERLQIRDVVREGMTWAQLYGGAAVLVVTEDDVPQTFAGAPREWLKQPIDLERVGRVHAFHVFDAFSARPAEWENDITSPSYRLPRTWSVSDDNFSADVHHSRILHFRGTPRTPSRRRHGSGGALATFPDNSWVQALWDGIRNFTDTMQGGASVAHELRHAILKLKDFGSVMSGPQEAAFKERMVATAQAVSSLGLVLLGPEDDYQQRSTPPAGFVELSDSAKMVLSGVSGIPQQELWGDTPSGLSTDGASGKEGFRATISEFQQKHRRPLKQGYTILLASQDGPTQGQFPPEWDVKFAPLDEPSEPTQAELREAVARTDAMLIDAGLVSAEHIRRHRYGPDGWKFDIPGMDEQQIADLEYEAEARKRMQAVQQQMMMQGGGADGENPDGTGDDGALPPGDGGAPPGAPGPTPPPDPEAPPGAGG